MKRLGLGLGVAALALLGQQGCSLITDFDRFEGQDDDPCAGRPIGPCEMATPDGDVCRVEPRPAGASCETTGGSCLGDAGTCNAVGDCEPDTLPVGTPCDADPGGCFSGEGECDAVGVCVAMPLPAGTACTPTEPICARAECDGDGNCGVGRIVADNDVCARAVLVAGASRPGPVETIEPVRCIGDDAEATCSPRGARDAFYAVELPVPRTLRLDLRRPSGAPLGVPGSIALSETCNLSTEIGCLSSGTDLPFDATLVPGTYFLMADVRPAPGDEFPPVFQVGIFVDPQSACDPEPPVLFAPPSGGDTFADGSTVGATDDFIREGFGTTRDHVWAFEVERRGGFRIETFPVVEDQLAEEEENLTDTVLSVRDACADDERNLLAENDDNDLGLYSTIEIDLEPGRYYVVVDNFSIDDDEPAGSYVLGITGL